jgi:transcription elongation factor GreA
VTAIKGGLKMNIASSRPTLTLAGRMRLEKDLERHRERLNDATERLKQEHPDTDSLTWYSTQEELALTHSRIEEREAALLADPNELLSAEADTIGLGSSVAVKNEGGREHSFEIVTPIEADAARELISLESPVDAALLGRRIRESVSVLMPRSQRYFRILGVDGSSGEDD